MTTTTTTTKTTSTGAKVKQTSVITMLDLIGFATEAGKSALAVTSTEASIKTAFEARTKALAGFNTSALSIKNSGVVLVDGRKKGKEAEQTLALKTAFIDSLGDLASDTKQAYYEIFRKVVNTGEKAKGMNKSKDGKRSKADKVKGEKAEGEFINAIVALYNHSEFNTLTKATKTELVNIMIIEGVLEQADFEQAIA